MRHSNVRLNLVAAILVGISAASCEAGVIMNSAVFTQNIPLVYLQNPSQPGACTITQPVSQFTDEDSDAVFVFSGAGAVVGQIFDVQWHTPGGAVYQELQNTAWANGSFCFMDNLFISGQPAATYPGTWEVDVSANGVLLGSATFTLQAKGFQITSAFLSKTVPPNGSCAAPAPANGFATTDWSANFFAVLENVQLTDSGQVQWIDPNGTVQLAQLLYPTPGHMCTSSSLTFPETPVIGAWTVKFYWDNTLRLTLPFTLTDATPGIDQVTVASPGAPVTITGKNLTGATIAMNGIPVTVLDESDSKVVVQAPWRLHPGPTPVTVSKSFRNAAGQAQVVLTNPVIVGTPSGPVQRGSTIQVTATGLGIAGDLPQDGSPGYPDSVQILPVFAHIGKVPAPVISAKLATSGIGVSVVDIVVPNGVPNGQAVPLELIAGANVSQPAGLQIAGDVPVPPAMHLHPLPSGSVAPATLLTLTVDGLDDSLPVAVRVGGQDTHLIQPFGVSGKTLNIAVPPYYDAAHGGFGPGHLTLQVVESAGGVEYNSNTQTLSVTDLPKVNAAPGKFTAAVLRAAAQGSAALRGKVLLQESTYAVYPPPVSAANAGLSGQSSAALNLAHAIEEGTGFDPAVLSLSDRLLASYVAAIVPQTVQNPQGAAVPGNCLEAVVPSQQGVYDDLLGGSPVKSYAQDYQNCLDTYSLFKQPDDFSAQAARWNDGAQRAMDAAVSFFLPPAAAGVFLEPQSPRAATVALAEIVAGVTAVPNAVNVAAQTLTELGSVYALYQSGSGPMPSTDFEAFENRMLQATYKQEIQQVFNGIQGGAFDQSTLTAAEEAGINMASSWVKAAGNALDGELDATLALVNPSVGQNNDLEPVQVEPHHDIPGEVTDPATLQPDTEAEVMMGAEPAPSTASPTYRDGSFELTIPERLCPNVCTVETNSAEIDPQERSVLIAANSIPDHIDFPSGVSGASNGGGAPILSNGGSNPAPSNQNVFYSGTALVVESSPVPPYTCNLYFIVNVTLAQVNLSQLMSSGGDFHGTYSYSTYSSCTDPTVSAPSPAAFNQPFSGTVNPGGSFTLDIMGYTWQNQLSPGTWIGSFTGNCGTAQSGSCHLTGTLRLSGGVTILP